VVYRGGRSRSPKVHTARLPARLPDQAGTAKRYRQAVENKRRPGRAIHAGRGASRSSAPGLRGTGGASRAAGPSARGLAMQAAARLAPPVPFLSFANRRRLSSAIVCPYLTCVIGRRRRRGRNSMLGRPPEGGPSWPNGSPLPDLPPIWHQAVRFARQMRPMRVERGGPGPPQAGGTTPVWLAPGLFALRPSFCPGARGR